MSNDIKELHPLLLQLANADQRESALLVLCKNREAFPDIAAILANPAPFGATPIPSDEE